MSNDYLTIVEITQYLKRKFDADPYLERVFLTGELSNFRPRPNAHQYFSLKDDRAKINAVMFKPAFSKLKFQPVEGMKVLVVGRITLYEASGNYQIVIEHMEPDGVGALYQAFEQLKAKLMQEGLFSAPKKAIPRFPKKIAVITSPSGAVIRDIITTTKRRYPIAQLVLFPTVVQGNNSADDIVRQIQRVEDSGDFDTLIIGRGGGSIEDLWPFNEERVARAIFNAQTPIISSVGHETDTTIADLVADLRAPTPTAAAELAVPVLTDELLKLQQQQMRVYNAFLNQLKIKQQRLKRIEESYVFRQPERLYEKFEQRLSELQKRQNDAIQREWENKQQAFQMLEVRLLRTVPSQKIAYQQDYLKQLQQQLQRNLAQLFQNKQNQFKKAVDELDLLSPLKIMGRGYTYATKGKNEVIKSVTQLEQEEKVSLHFVDGQAEVEVKSIDKGELKNG